MDPFDHHQPTHPSGQHVPLALSVIRVIIGPRNENTGILGYLILVALGRESVVVQYLGTLLNFY